MTRKGPWDAATATGWSLAAFASARGASRRCRVDQVGMRRLVWQRMHRRKPCFSVEVHSSHECTIGHCHSRGMVSGSICERPKVSREV